HWNGWEQFPENAKAVVSRGIICCANKILLNSVSMKTPWRMGDGLSICIPPMVYSAKNRAVTNGTLKVSTRFRTVVFIVRISRTCSLEDGLSAQHTLLSRPHASWLQRPISPRPLVWRRISLKKKELG